MKYTGKLYNIIAFISLLLLIASIHLSAHIRLPKLVGDNMVLQRDAALPIWGWQIMERKLPSHLSRKNIQLHQMQLVNGW
jgi:sialate O-acetylesterase